MSLHNFEKFTVFPSNSSSLKAPFQCEISITFLICFDILRIQRVFMNLDERAQLRLRLELLQIGDDGLVITKRLFE